MNRRNVLSSAVVFGIIFGVFLITVFIQRYSENKENAARMVSREKELKKVNPGAYDKFVSQVESGKQLVNEQPDSYDNWVSLGLAQQSLGNYSGAEDSYLSAIEINNSGFVALNNLADIYTERGDYDLAEKYFLKVTEKIPTEQSSYLKLAEIYVKDEVKKIDEAKKILELGISKAAQNEALKGFLNNIK